MGNHASTGHAINMCGCHESVVNNSAQAVITMHGIEPWDAHALIMENLNRQGVLARRTPLRKVPVAAGLAYMKDKASLSSSYLSMASGGYFQSELGREKFVELCVMMLGVNSIPHSPQDREDLYLVFDSMDFDRNGSLSTGEWAAGLSVFCKGSQDEAVRAVFGCLDTNSSMSISKKELQVYLAPFVKAMSPTEAAALRPLLEKKAVDQIYKEMDADNAADISVDEMIAWTKKGNNIVDKLADIIGSEVYHIWRESGASKKPRQNNGGYGMPGQQPYGQNPQFGPGGPGQNPPYGQGGGYPGQYGPGGGYPGQYGPGGGYPGQYGQGGGYPGQYSQGGSYGGPPGQYGQGGPGGPPGSYGGPPGQNGQGGFGGPPQGGYGPSAGQSPASGQSSSWLGSLFGGGSASASNPGSPAGSPPGSYGAAANQRAVPAPPNAAADPFEDSSWQNLPPPPAPPGRGSAPPGGGWGGGGVPPPPAYNQAPQGFPPPPSGSSSAAYRGAGGY